MNPVEPWLSPLQRQYPKGKMTELFTIKSFGTVFCTHRKERRLAKSDINLQDEEGVLVGYDDTQESFLARIYFSTT